MLVAWIGVGTLLSLTVFRSGRSGDNVELQCTFVAVGHGACVVVELPGGRTLMYDAGRLGPPSAGTRPISAVLWSRGIRRLDFVVLSHADADHFNALPKLLERFSVDAVYVSPTMFAQPNLATTELHRCIVAASGDLRVVAAGDRLPTSDAVVVEVLHPPKHGGDGGDNANSIVLSIERGGVRVLLTGDLAPPGLEDVLSRDALRTDVLMAPHHGSGQSEPAAFAAWATPRYVVISGGFRQDVSAAAEAYRRVGARVLHTAESGAVRVSIGPDALEVRTWRDHRWR
jgi:competence protein ComEC